MRVALFTDTFLPKLDGIVTVVLGLLDHLDKRGVEFMVIAPQLGEQPLTDYRGHPVHTVPGLPLFRYPELRVFIPHRASYQAVRDFNPDVLHFIHPIMSGTAGRVMAAWLDKPTLASFHLNYAEMLRHFGFGFLHGFSWWYMRQNFNACDLTLAPSRLLQEEMIGRGLKNVRLWRRGIDAERFHPRYRDAEMRAHLSDGHPEDALLLYVGRLSPEKRIQDLRPLLDNIPGTRLAIVGDGPMRAELEQHFAGTNTKFVGYLKGEALSQAFASADIFTFASALETFGMVLVEAMASGLPVVTTEVGGARDVIQPGVNGYYAPVGDTAGLVAGVRAILSEPGKLDAMRGAARAFAETQTWDAINDEVIACYTDLIEGHREKARTPVGG